MARRLLLGTVLALSFVACGESHRSEDPVGGAAGAAAGHAGSPGSGASGRAGSGGTTVGGAAGAIAGASGRAAAGGSQATGGGGLETGGENNAERAGESNETGGDGSSAAGAGSGGATQSGGGGGLSVGGSLGLGGSSTCTGLNGGLKQVSECEFAFVEPPGDPRVVNVLIDGEVIPYADCSDDPGAWMFAADAVPRLVLCPDVCDYLNTSADPRLQVSIGCVNVRR